jgi:hypothetical protein
VTGATWTCAKPTRTNTYKLKPTPEQVRQLEEVVWRCRTLYNTALEERITAYRRCGVTRSRYQQEAELKDIRAALPEYAAIHSHIQPHPAGGRGATRHAVSGVLPSREGGANTQVDRR